MSVRRWQEAMAEHLERHDGQRIPFDLVLLVLIESNTRQSVRLLRRILKALEPGPTAHVNLRTILTDKEGHPVATPITLDPNVNDTLHQISPTDANGVPTTGDTWTWQSTDPAVLTLEVAADGLSAKGRSNPANPGTANVIATNGTVSDSQQVISVVTPPPPGPTANVNLTGVTIPKGA